MLNPSDSTTPPPQKKNQQQSHQRSPLAEIQRQTVGENDDHMRDGVWGDLRINEKASEEGSRGGKLGENETSERLE